MADLFCFFVIAPHFVIFSTRVESFCWRSIPSWPFTVVVLGTQVIALIISVYGFFGYDDNIESIGWPMGLVILAISLGTFIITDICKVLLIQLWNHVFDKRSSSPSIGSSVWPSKKSRVVGATHGGTRAQQFMQRRQHEMHSRVGYDRAMRRDSVSSVQSY